MLNVCRKCGGCKREIVQGNYLGCMGEFFHPECFCCCACGYPITEPEVGNYMNSLIFNIKITIYLKLDFSYLKVNGFLFFIIVLFVR